jgi:hypothetical protein
VRGFPVTIGIGGFGGYPGGYWGGYPGYGNGLAVSTTIIMDIMDIGKLNSKWCLTPCEEFHRVSGTHFFILILIPIVGIVKMVVI